MMHQNYIQLPPNSTGPQIGVVPLCILPVLDASAFNKEDIVIGGTGNNRMRVAQRNIYSNLLYLKYTTELQEGGQYLIGENLLVGGVIKSTVTGEHTIHYFNTSSLTSHDNPFHGQRVDAQGQAYIRYEEGAQILDSLGRSKTVLDHVSGTYKFSTVGSWNSAIQATVVGTAASSMDPTNFGLKVQTGVMPGDTLNLTSHKYHAHVSGTGLYVELLCQLGDSGKENLSREWGYADTENGIFFDIMGTELNLVIRSHTNGSTVDSHIAQSSWNRDRLDGTGISALTLDVTKLNKYWFDFNRGVRFRAGIYGPDGTRVVCHDIKIANTTSELKMPVTSLPIRIHQTNIGNVISTSEMTFFEGCVITEGQPDMHRHFYEAGGIVRTVTNAAWTPLVSLRPQTDSRHSVALLLDAAISAVTSINSSNDGRVKVEVFKNAVLTGATFATTKGDSRYNVDTFATAMSGGSAIAELFMKGTETKDISRYCNYLDEFLIQYIDGTKNTYTLAAKAIAEDCDVIGAINWNEYSVR